QQQGQRVTHDAEGNEPCRVTDRETDEQKRQEAFRSAGVGRCPPPREQKQPPERDRDIQQRKTQIPHRGIFVARPIEISDPRIKQILEQIVRHLRVRPSIRAGSERRMENAVEKWKERVAKMFPEEPAPITARRERSEHAADGEQEKGSDRLPPVAAE